MDNILETVSAQTRQAAEELLEAAHLRPGDLFVVGCSSSEILGDTIGTAASMDAAGAVVEALLPLLKEKGIRLAAQCCEHLNRALIMEAETAEAYGYETVNVMPQPKAGGSFATTVWQSLAHPVAVEEVKAHAGLDIGGTLIGMHLRPVAVPVRLSVKKIGEASILCARTRPKFIGGVRAVYNEELL